jgi:hypothetical protein
MGVYAYCVVPPGHAPSTGVTGLDDKPVELVPIGEVALWVSRLARPNGSVAQITAHNKVVEAAVTNEVTPVPLRFGQWLDNEAALHAAMVDKTASYQEKLQEFAGCLEFGIRVLDPNAPSGARDVQQPAATTGYEYMQALRENSKLAEQRRAVADQVRQQIHNSLQPLVRAEREEEPRTPHAVITLSHLVPRPHFDGYRERARGLREVLPALRLLLSGPWPPYSFAA